jgi:hypothetical protein
MSYINRFPLGLLLLSASALGLAPRLMPASYDWLRHTTSESAAQGVTGAWLARLGFLLFGLAVVWIAIVRRPAWTAPVRALHMAFGLMMIATAAFSTRSWEPAATFDPVEDGLHSFTATTMGFAFALGLGLRLPSRGRDRVGQGLDLLGMLAAVAIPLAMGALTDWTGVLQRGMFATAYLWYAREIAVQPDLAGPHVA